MSEQTDGTLWLVTPDAQRAEVDKYCFGDCGKIIVGAVALSGFNWFPCRIKDCPFVEKEVSTGTTDELFGKTETIILRRLKELPK